MISLDAPQLLKASRRFAKTVSALERTDVRIAIVGTCSVQFFSSALRYVLHERGIEAEIFEGPYDGINAEVLNPQSRLYDFNPDVVILIPYHSDIKAFPKLLASSHEVEEAVETDMAWFGSLWKSLERLPSCTVFQANIVLPLERSLGNLESNNGYSKRSVLTEINLRLAREHPAEVTIIDLDYIASAVGKLNWFDCAGYFNAKLGYRITYLPEVVDAFATQIEASMGRVRKCLVLDLDNTLWGGVVGEVGACGVSLEPGDALGEAYRHFQGYVLDLKRRGVILAVCSKNEDDLAKGPFLHNDNMLLKLDDISCFVANWEDKATNIKAIASALNIGVDSIVFFDDNPAERELVRSCLPEVHVVDVPEDPAEYALQLEAESPFEWLQLTQEDIDRAGTYASNAQRDDLLDSFVDYDSYLEALEMRGRVWQLDEASLPRFTQLINKTNQFNFRTQRYSEAQIKEMMLSEDHLCLCGSLADRFGDYGLISCMILKREDAGSFFIDTWVMSCRVFNRGMERFMLQEAVALLGEVGCRCLEGEYILTKKNAVIADLLESLGFEVVSKDDESAHYAVSLEDLDSEKTWIERNS